MFSLFHDKGKAKIPKRKMIYGVHEIKLDDSTLKAIENINKVFTATVTMTLIDFKKPTFMPIRRYWWQHEQ